MAPGIMPAMDGTACFHELAKLDPGARIIVATGHALNGAAQALLDEGALGFVQKPFVKAELADAVAKALGGVRAETSGEGTGASTRARSPEDAGELSRQLAVRVHEVASLLDAAGEAAGVGEGAAAEPADLAAQLRRAARRVGGAVAHEARHELGDLLLDSRLLAAGLRSAAEAGSPARAAARAAEDAAASAIGLAKKWWDIAGTGKGQGSP